MWHSRSIALLASWLLTCTSAAATEPIVVWKGIGAWAVAFSGDGKFVAAIGQIPGNPKTISDALAPRNSVLKVWDNATHREIFGVVDSEKRMACLAVSPKPPYLAIGYEDQEIEVAGAPENRSPLVVWNIAEKKKLVTLASAVRFHCVAFSPSGKWLASASAIAGEKFTQLNLWEMPTGKPGRQWKVRRDQLLAVRTLAFSHDERFLAFGGGSGFPQTGKKNSTKGLLGVIDVESGDITSRFADSGDWVQSAAFSADGKYLAWSTAEQDGRITVYHWLKKETLSRFKPHTHGAQVVLFGRESEVLFTSGIDREKNNNASGVWKAWNVSNSRLLESEKTEKFWPVCMALSPDGRLLAVGGPEGVQLRKATR